MIEKSDYKSEDSIDKPLISIVIILKDFYHLVNLTLESIVNQTSKYFEIIVVETSKSKKDLIMLKPFLDKIKKIEHLEDSDLATLMNKGVSLSEGKYVHFLYSGDIYISKYTMDYLKDLIIQKKNPNLICCAFLRRDEYSSSESVNFSFDYFKRGKIPMHIQSCWFSNEVIKKMGYFDTNFPLQSGFDMICKIFLNKYKKIIFSNRVLTDYQFKKKPSKIILLKALENIKIIYKNFGFVKTIFWWAIHDHFRMLKLFFLSVKKAFWNP